MLAQTVIDGQKIDTRRTLAFATFSGAYLGIGQHYVYNVMFTRLLGSRTDLWTGIRKSAVDSLVHVPCCYLPLYYPFETVMLGKGTVGDGLRRYRADSYNVLTAYWTMWPPVHVLNFTIVPTELRIAFVATASLVWLTYLSWSSHEESYSHDH